MTNKFELSDKLRAVDQGLASMWNDLDEDQIKGLSKDLYILNRYISNVENQKTEIQEHFVTTVNKRYNKNYFLIAKHPKLQWMLLCSCHHPSYKVFFHKWIGFKKKEGSDNKKITFLSSLYPAMKMDEIEMLAKIMPAKELTRLAKDYGFDDSDIKKQLK